MKQRRCDGVSNHVYLSRRMDPERGVEEEMVEELLEQRDPRRRQRQQEFSWKRDKSFIVAALMFHHEVKE